MNIERIKSIRISSMYCFLVCLFCVNTIIAETELFVPVIYRIVNYFIYIMLISISFYMAFLTARYRGVIIKFTILLLGVLSAFFSGSNYMLISILFLLAFNRTHIRKVIKTYFITNTVCIALVVILSLLGVIGSIYTYREGSDMIRNSLGFNHVNVLANHLIVIMLTYIYLRYKDFALMNYIYMFSGLIVGYYVTHTNTLLVMGVFGIVSLVVFRILYTNKRKQWKYVFAVSPIICLILSFTPIFLFSERQNSILNRIFTNRVYFIKLFYEQYGLSLFGKNIKLIGSVEALKSHVSARILDNAYLHIAIRYGIVILAVFLIGYTKVALQSIREDCDTELIIIFLISIWGIIETAYFRFDYNPFILLLAFSFDYRNSRVLRKIKMIGVFKRHKLG